MSLHPGHHRRDGELEPIQRRPRERAAGAVFEAFTRVAGLRPGMIPEHLRRQLRIIGMRDEQLARVLPRLKSLADWPYAWEAEGDARAAEGDWAAAFAAWYVGQRILMAQSPLKRRLYHLSVEAYERMEQPPLERFVVENGQGDRVTGYLQLPLNATEQRLPCVLMVPGVTGTKEELHAYCMPFLKRGIAVARIDNPGYGETSGVLEVASLTNARWVFEHLERDARLDPARIHLHGMSLGAFFALHSAAGTRAASLTVLCPPFRPRRYFPSLPTLNLTALQHMTQLPDLDELIEFAGSLTLEQVAPTLTMPVRIFHGGRDRTIPVEDGIDLAAAVGGPVALTIYERDHHNCLEHIDEITALTLEFLRDPAGTCLRQLQLERVDAPATVQVTDRDAQLASAGIEPKRRLARLPFLLPGAKPRPESAAG